ncbi:uracil-DNA glycosylase family protein [Tautonia sociabilis]|uniref:Uracil-DNA glycosylase n=1 Tax=Tautonia sociabilis TaxID=2080755 RepID=A0A432MNA5_9BACT|nr:uracil-DNA glycosylase family protein [Tautonia sociabilis]RUL88924.1 uracil-DNA glycosylase [Tautonia sociabilis]
MRTLDELIEAIHQEALRADFPIDEPVYEASGKDPRRPILFAGSLSAPICSFGRDLGKDEVKWGQPQIGAGGKLVRQGVYRKFIGEPTNDDPRLERALGHVLLSNTVPYKPPGNKAYSESVKARFRPFVAEFLAGHWSGNRVLSLGTEAFRWFSPYAEPGAADEFWNREDRYEAEFPCELVAKSDGGETEIRKPIVVCPLPHPSPLNQRWYPRFSGLLKARLDAIEAS